MPPRSGRSSSSTASGVSSCEFRPRNMSCGNGGCIRVELLPIGEAATLQAGKLPGLHPDPFDRIIVKQAISQGFAIVTSAPLIRVYPMPVAWSCVRQETGDPPLHPCRRLR